jgi:metal-responsive CopG/Arc/MetJ family transcriptional regulator
MQSYVRTSIVLPKELAEWIKKQAAIENRSINNFIQTILLEKKREQQNNKKEITCLSMQ